ncbi:MAG: TPM domain-containing protein, partial [Lachnospiraceae bacterium]|nr:TPM domain-containing protein [Lachnospiraceae bacterium]
DGVSRWIELFYNLYTKGDPFAPTWMPDDVAAFERFHNEDAPRVDDAAYVLSMQSREDFEKRVAELSKKYGKDIVVHTTKNRDGMTEKEYAQKYFLYNGYGYGENYDGILLLISTSAEDPGWKTTTYASGSGRDKLTEVNKERLEGFCRGKLDSYDFSGAVDIWLRKLDGMERTGRVSRSFGYWLWITIFSLLSGAGFGGVSSGRALKKMEAPALAGNADVYLLAGSLSVTGGDKFLNTTTNKIYDPITTSSSSSERSSGSSGGRSSYTSSHVRKAKSQRVLCEAVSEGNV